MSDYKFTPEQEAWLKDLETTDAPQCIEQLQCDDAFCCLGRACIVLSVPSERAHGSGSFFFDGEMHCLSKPTVKRLGLRGDNGDFEVPVSSAELDRDGGFSVFNSLTDMNDNGLSFREIAAYIRSNPHNVFLPPEE